MLAAKKPDWQKQYLALQQLVSCTGKNGCKGGDSYSALQYFQTNGYVYETQFPYQAINADCIVTPATPKAFSTITDIYLCTSGIGTYPAYLNYQNGKKLPSPINVPGLCSDVDFYNLLQNGPVSVTIDGTAIQQYTGGIYDSPCKT